MEAKIPDVESDEVTEEVLKRNFDRLVEAEKSMKRHEVALAEIALTCGDPDRDQKVQRPKTENHHPRKSHTSLRCSVKSSTAPSDYDKVTQQLQTALARLEVSAERELHWQRLVLQESSSSNRHRKKLSGRKNI